MSIEQKIASLIEESKVLQDETAEQVEEITEEEVDLDEEQIDELSKSTLGSYTKKAALSAVKSGVKMVRDMSDGSESQDGEKTMAKRFKGINRATDKLTKEEAELDEEQLDELSKKTLGSYIKKATDWTYEDPRTIGNLSSKSTEKDIKSGGEDGGEEAHKARMRSKGVAKAVNRLTKEEVDLDEEQTEQE